MYGKIDPETVERIEVIRGPNSALYGSNALGAVMNVITRSSPFDYTEEGMRTGMRIKLDYQSVNEAGGARTEVYGATPNLRFLLGGSARDFDDVEGGGNLGDLDPSDGREKNWDFSGEAKLSEGRFLKLTVQDVHRDHMTRYYRPTQDNTNDREAVALTYTDQNKTDWWDVLEARAYWQEKVDERRFFDTDTKGRATTKTLQGGLQLTRYVGSGHVLTGGVQAELTKGDSPDDEQFTRIVPSPKRRDAPLSRWYDFGVYLQDEWEVDPRWSITGSLRYDHQRFKTRVDRSYVPPLGDPEDDEVDDKQHAVTGGLGIVRHLTPELNVSANYARGFRQNAPNFGLRQLGDGVLIPNELLDETTSDNFEVGVKGRYPGLRFEAATYYSLIDNWQGDLRPTMFNGGSFFDVNQNGQRDANEGYVTQVEGGDAYVFGIEASAAVNGSVLSNRIPDDWSLWGSFAWNKGTVDSTDSNPHSEPMRHTQPMRGLIGIRWDHRADPERGLYFELVTDMVGRYDNIPSDRQEGDLAWREDPQDGDSGFLRSYVGTPGYTIFHLYAGVNLTDNTKLKLGVENITDKKYRVAHSRMDAPGVGLLASIEVTF
jgi:outer membrane receptor protein involved in Fe transport